MCFRLLLKDAWLSLICPKHQLASAECRCSVHNGVKFTQSTKTFYFQKIIATQKRYMKVINETLKGLKDLKTSVNKERNNGDRRPWKIVMNWWTTRRRESRESVYFNGKRGIGVYSFPSYHHHDCYCVAFDRIRNEDMKCITEALREISITKTETQNQISLQTWSAGL